MSTVSFSLEGKTALVTGASRGIGEAIARTFAANGAQVILVSRKQETLDEVAESIKQDGGAATGIAAHCGPGWSTLRTVPNHTQKLRTRVVHKAVFKPL